MESVYDRYGGFAGVHRVVADFYDRILDSDRLAPFFEGIDLTRLVDHQTQFVTSLLGGPATIPDARLRAAHAAHAIDDADFDEMARIFAETLADHDFDARDIAAVLSAVETRRGLIVT